MSNAPSFGKTRFLSLLLVGAVAGFAACTTSPPDVAGPPPVVCTEATGTDQVVNITEDVTKKEITIDHDQVHVNVDRCDQVVWVWASEPTEEFTVSLELEAPPVPTPPNPFPRTFTASTGPTGQVRFEAATTTGTLASEHAVPAVKGHLYKFTITAINRPDLEPLDPHVVFD